jgi:hypothetical protein
MVLVIAPSLQFAAAIPRNNCDPELLLNFCISARYNLVININYMSIYCSVLDDKYQYQLV